MEDYKKFIRNVFDSVSRGYDNENLRFFDTTAGQLVEFLGLKGDEKVLDIAAGTGKVTVNLAQKLNQGTVHATDISGEMLQVIKDKTELYGLSNVSFEEVDMETLSHGPVYDAATCSFGIFFLADMLRGLKQIKKNIKPAGTLGITTFNENFGQPLVDIFYRGLAKYGFEKKSSPWENINTIEKTRYLLSEAGFSQIKIIKEQQGYYLKNSGAWWQVVMNAALKAAFEQIPEGKRDEFVKGHLQEIEQLATDKGIWMDVEVIFALGYV